MIKIIAGLFVVVVAVAAGWWVWSASGDAAVPPVPDFVTNLYGTSTPPTQTQSDTQAPQPQAEAITTNPSTSSGQVNKIMQATLHTNKGDITIEFSNATPNTVANFVKLAQAGFYNGTKFHRVIAGFMIQGGDPLTKDDTMAARWGTGGPGYQFNDEIGADNHNNVGTIAMANAGPNTNGSQFFINVASNNFLDTKHTVFGKVTAGMDVVSAIVATPTDSSDRPTSPIVVTSVSVK